MTLLFFNIEHHGETIGNVQLATEPLEFSINISSLTHYNTAGPLIMHAMGLPFQWVFDPKMTKISFKKIETPEPPHQNHYRRFQF